jgi:hypothetical protein
VTSARLDSYFQASCILHSYLSVSKHLCRAGALALYLSASEHFARTASRSHPGRRVRLSAVAPTMATEPLQHLTEQSASVGAWMLKVAMEPQVIEYQWVKNGKTMEGRKLEVVLVSEDSTKYCQGLYRRMGKEPKASQDFDAAKRNFQKGTIWKVSKVSFVKQNPKYLGCSCKIGIDMNLSRFAAVLQSTVPMPKQATPPEDLATLLECHDDQVVDVIALVKEVTQPEERRTTYGDRLKVDVTIMDDSGENKAASSKFTAWFPTKAAIESDQLQLLRECEQNQTPLAFFNLVCQKDKQMASASEHAAVPKTTLRTSKDKFTFEICDEGTRAKRLAANAASVLSIDNSQITVVSELPTFVPYSEIDYRAIDGTLTVCRLLHYTMQAGPALMSADVPDGSAEPTVFQINHARIIEPKAGENLLTNEGNRLFPTVRVVDPTGTVELKMREKAVLTISGARDKDEFTDLASMGSLNFPILTSMRVAVSIWKEKGASEHTEGRLSAIIVEATEQDLLVPKAVPNASMEYLNQLLLSLPLDSNRMLVAPMSAVRLARHTGMVVNTSGPAPLQATCVLSLVAHVGRSLISDLAGGHKLVSKGCWNVPFEMPATQEEGAPEHADKKVLGNIASYCTMENVQDYTLTGRKPGEAVYALIVISSVHEDSGDSARLTYMVDKVEVKNGEDIPTIRALLRKLTQIFTTEACKQNPNSTPDWSKEQTPYKAKKTRRLSYSPTDADLPSPSANS